MTTTSLTTRDAYRSARRAYRAAVHADRQAFNAAWDDANCVYRDQRAPLPWPTMDRQREVLAGLPAPLAAAVQSRPARARLSEAALRLASHFERQRAASAKAAAIAGAVAASRALDARRATEQMAVAA